MTDNDAKLPHIKRGTRKLRVVAAQLRRCEGTEGRPVARRNARKRVLAALRAVRAHLDATYPAIVARKGREQATPETIRKRMLRAGWKEAWGSAGLYAAAGVPVRRMPHQTPGGAVLSGYTLVVPGWAAAIGPENQAQLRAAKKSVKLRRAALAKAALLADE